VREKLGGVSVVKWLGAGLFLFALLIRLPGIGWGLKNDLHNASYHPDEPVNFAYSRMIVPAAGQFFPPQPIPRFYSYGTLYLTLLRVASDVTSTYTGGPKVKGDGFSWSNPDHTDWDWVSRCDMAGRFISALAGAGTAWVCFLIMLRVFGKVAGVSAGLLLAVAPAHVMHSRFQTVDVLATFFLAVSLMLAVKVAMDEKVGWKTVLWCGAFAGLSAGTKYTGILALLGLFVALGVRRPPKAILMALASVGTSLVVFVLTTPGALLDSANFWNDFTYEMAHTAEGHGLVFAGTPSGFLYQALNLTTGVGLVLAVMGLAGLIWAGVRKHTWAWIMLAFCIPYYLSIGRAEVKFIRYTFPLYIGLACGFGYAVAASHRRGGGARVGVGLGILGIGASLAYTSEITVGMMGADPRDTAAKYIKTAAKNVGITANNWFWSPALFPNSAEPLAVPEPVRLSQMAQATPPVLFVTTPDGNPTEWDTKLIDGLKPDLITFSSFQFFPIERTLTMKDLPDDIRPSVEAGRGFIADLEGKYEHDKSFGGELFGGDAAYFLPEDFLYTNPIVWVWKRKPGL